MQQIVYGNDKTYIVGGGEACAKCIFVQTAVAT